MCSVRYIIIEFLLLFVLLPTLFVLLGQDSIELIIPVLLLVAGYCIYVISKACYQGEHSPVKRLAWKGVLLRFIFGGILVSWGYYILSPGEFMSLPKQNISAWLLILILYPLLSVIPQELIYRKFLFKRCEALNITSPIAVITMSSITFSYAHLVFGTWQAIVMTLVGGLLFSYNYYRNRSLLMVWLEHALWGDLLFTIGLGKYFLGGTIGKMLSFNYIH